MNLEARERLFHEALALPSPQERAAFLQGACGGDSALRDEVLALLEAHDRTVPFPATETGEAGPGETLVEGPGTVIGRYKLLQQIGEGGMGVVYMAEQTEPVTRKVALKIIKLGMDTRQVVARFEAERQALALMDHPNIAKVLDAGSTSTGRPYFVMELVRGIPITQYCDQHHLSARQRLELFIPVCHAIQHAHQKGILHRDIKPSNVLVALHDGRPLPMVIDFGIAKATHQRLTEKTLFTQFGNIIGTPAYMSPEQAEMNQLDVDTRTDIYSLGVLLYELLTGTTPFSAKELLDAGYAGMQRMIAEREPPRPSTRLSTMLEAQRTTVARNRCMEPSALTRLFQGDLDWVVMRCLEKERARRYESASGLAADLERHLHSEPVTARPPTAAYRFQKALRRNRAAFVAGAVVALALIAGFSLSSWQAVVATRARTAALDAKARETTQRLDAQRARDEAQAAQAIAQEARNAEQGLRVQAERDLYASRLNLAQQAWARNNGGQLRRILEATRNSPHRGFEWAYWEKHARGTQRVLHGHDQGMVSVAWSPDGHRIATAGFRDGWIKVWDALTGRELASAVAEGGLMGGVVDVTFSPDGKQIASAGSTSVKFFDAISGQTLRTLFSDNEFSVAFSPDGTQVVTSSGSQPIRFWDLASGTVVKTLESTDGDQGTSVATSRDFRTLVSGHGDGTVRVWDLPEGTERFRRKVREGMIQCITYSLATDCFAVGTAESAEVWEASTGRRILRIATGLHGLYALAFSAEGARLATGTQDGAIQIWDASTGECLGVMRSPGGGIHSIAFSPDGRSIVAGNDDGTAEVWKAPQADMIENPPDFSRAPIARPGIAGHGTLSFSEDSSRLRIDGWEAAVVWSVGDGETVSTLFLTNSQPRSASRDWQRMVRVSFDGAVHVTDGSKGTDLLVLDHAGIQCQATLSPDGTRVVTVTKDGAWKTWNGVTGRVLGTYTNQHLAGFSGGLHLAISPDSRRLVSCRSDSEDSELVCLDVTTGAELFAIKSQEQHYGVAAFSPDSQRLIVASGSRHPLADGRADGVQALVMDASTGRELLALRGDQDAIASLAYSPDGGRILTGGGGATMRVWDAHGGGELLALRTHSDGINAVAFSPDGRKIACLGYDGVARIWDSASLAEIGAWEEADVARQRMRERLAGQVRTQESIARRSSLLHWLVLGPIPMPTNLTIAATLDLKVLKAEGSTLPKAGDPGGDGLHALRWRHVGLRYPVLSSREFAGRFATRSVTYGATYVRSDAAVTNAVLRLGTSSHIKVWLNGTEIPRSPTGPIPTEANRFSGLTFLRGTNVLVLKIAAEGETFISGLAFTDPDNNPLNGVEVIPQTADPANIPPRSK